MQYNRKNMEVGSRKNTFAVEYLANGDDDMGKMHLRFLMYGDRQEMSKQIQIQTINTKCEAEQEENEKNSEFLECKICLLKYDEDERIPRILTCGHTLCSECAESLWKVQNRQRIICPFDRTVTTLPNFQLGINSLAKNFSLLEMLGSEKTRKAPIRVESLNSTTTEPSDTPCAENPYHEATVFCVNCEVDLCEECHAQGHILKILQKHKKLPLSEKPVQLPKCPCHPHNTAKFKCQESSCSKPSKLLCQTCLLQEHKGHSYEHLMETVSKNRKELEDLISAICGKMEMLQDFIHNQKQSIACYQQNSDMVIEKRNNLTKQFEEKKRKALSEFDAGVDLRKQICQQINAKLVTQSRNVSEVKKEIEKILKSKVNLFCIEDVAKRTENFLDEELTYYDESDLFDVVLNEKMELEWELEEETTEE